MGSAADDYLTDRKVRKILGPHFENSDASYIETMRDRATALTSTDQIPSDIALSIESGNSAHYYGSPRPAR